MKWKWRLTGYGGSAGGHNWERMMTEVEVRRNGSFLTFPYRMPGDRRIVMIMIPHADLKRLVADDRQHGDVEEITIQSDCPTNLAYAEHSGEIVL